MAFDMQIIHWPTLAEFAAYLASVARPGWCSGATVHNTYIPNEAQWRGLTSMNSMAKTYIGKGWSAGPHLYLAAECPNPNDRGIWQMTPLAHQGVHAGPCNTHRIGVENVADWQARPPTPAQYDLLLDVLEVIFQRWGLEGNAVNVHKECMDRTCPGQYLSPVQLRADLTTRLAAPPPNPALGLYQFDGLAVYQRADLTGQIADYLPPGSIVSIDAVAGPGYAPTAGHLLSGLGFVDMRLLRKVGG